MKKNVIYSCKCDGCETIITGAKARNIIIHKKSGQTKKAYCSKECRESSRPIKKEIINCKQCENKFEIYKRSITENNFCSHKCAASYNNKHRFIKVKNENGNITKTERPIKVKKYCLDCVKLLKDAIHGYCFKCRKEKYRKEYLIRWKAGLETGHDTFYKVTDIVRAYLLNKSGNKCSECGWDKINKKSKRCPLHVDHIDGDHKNGRENNLRVLCPNCHALTETYGSLNNGRGREHKKEYNRKYKVARAKLIRGIDVVVAFSPSKQDA